MHTVNTTIETRYTYLEWVGGVANMLNRLLLFTANTTCKSRRTMVEFWHVLDGPKSKTQRPSRCTCAANTTAVPGITEVWAGALDMVGKVPYPWPQCGVARRTKSSDVRRKIRSETQDVLHLGASDA